MKLIECWKCHFVSDDGCNTWHEKKTDEDWKAEDVDICEKCRQLHLEELYRDMQFSAQGLEYTNWRYFLKNFWWWLWR